MIYRWRCNVCGVHCQSSQERIGGFTHCLQKMRPISEDEYWRRRAVEVGRCEEGGDGGCKP